MARRADWRRVKRHRNYSVEEAARATGACKGTVRRWLKNGLPAVTDRKPALILGPDLIDFLAARQKPKQRCRLHECFCFSCRQPRPPALAEVEFFPLTASSGNLRALCATCTTIMHKRVSTAKLDELRALVTVTIRQASGGLVDTSNPCPGVHQAKEAEPDA
jgi:hypothetical protein